MKNYVIIGPGECAAKKIIPEFFRNTNEVQLTGLIGVETEDEVRRRFAKYGTERDFDQTTYQKYDPNNDSLVEVVNSFGKDIDGVLITTPHDIHLLQAVVMLEKGHTVYLEKPPVANMNEFSKLERTLENSVGRLFCADYYTDTKAIGLLAALGVIDKNDWRVSLLTSQTHEEVPDQFYGITRKLGNITKIEARLLESGEIGVVDHRPWLMIPGKGGMILDLMYHLGNMLFTIIKPENDLLLKSSFLGVNDGVNLGVYCHFKRESERAEDYGKVVLGSVLNNFDIKFKFGKYAKHNDRFFDIEYENGRVRLDFVGGNPVTVFSPDKGPIVVNVGGRPYQTEMEMFTKFVDSNQKEQGLDVARATIKFCDKVKYNYFRCLK